MGDCFQVVDVVFPLGVAGDGAGAIIGRATHRSGGEEPRTIVVVQIRCVSSSNRIVRVAGGNDVETKFYARTACL